MPPDISDIAPDAPQENDPYIAAAIQNQVGQHQAMMAKLLAMKAKKDRIRSAIQGQGALADNLATLSVQDRYNTATPEMMPQGEPTYGDLDKWMKIKQVLAQQQAARRPNVNVTMGQPQIIPPEPLYRSAGGSSATEMTPEEMQQYLQTHQLK